MPGQPIGPQPVVNPHLLTPNALKMAQGQFVNYLSIEDWNSIADYMIRVEILDSIPTVF